MRFLYNLVILVTFSVLFVSCKEDATTGPSVETGNYYNWSTQSASFSYVGNISAAVNNTLFVSGSKSYKIVDGVSTQINFNDSTFTSNRVFAYDDTYALFFGINTLAQQFLKIYDNGIISSYIWSPSTASGDVYFEAKNKFYFCNTNIFSNKYFYFNSGVVATYTLPGGVNTRFIRKTGDKIFLFVDSYSGPLAEVQAYKISASGFTLAFSGASQGYLFPLTNDVIRVTQDSLNHRFDYFTETGWQNLFSYSSPTNLQYVNQVAGDSKSFFLSFAYNYGGDFMASVYNGNSFTGQVNFIPTAFSGGSMLMSNYADNSVYFVNQLNATKIIKGKLK